MAAHKRQPARGQFVDAVGALTPHTGGRSQVLIDVSKSLQHQGPRVVDGRQPGEEIFPKESLWTSALPFG